jgi:hypothetical protein
VLSELGIDEAAYAKLREAGVVHEEDKT